MMNHRTVVYEGVMLQVRDNVMRQDSPNEANPYQEVDVDCKLPEYEAISGRLMRLGFALQPTSDAVFGGHTATFYRPMPMDPEEQAAREEEMREAIKLDEAIIKGVQVGSGRG